MRSAANSVFAKKGLRRKQSCDGLHLQGQARLSRPIGEFADTALFNCVPTYCAPQAMGSSPCRSRTMERSPVQYRATAAASFSRAWQAIPSQAYWPMRYPAKGVSAIYENGQLAFGEQHPRFYPDMLWYGRSAWQRNTRPEPRNNICMLCGKGVCSNTASRGRKYVLWLDKLDVAP